MEKLVRLYRLNSEVSGVVDRLLDYDIDQGIELEELLEDKLFKTVIERHRSLRERLPLFLRAAFEKKGRMQYIKPFNSIPKG